MINFETVSLFNEPTTLFDLSMTETEPFERTFSRIEKRVLHKEMVLYMTAYIHNTSDKIDYETKLLNKNLEEDIKKTFQKQFFINL